MRDIEDDLRRVLTDPAHELPPWPDAVQRVRSGMRMRHGRRMLARMSAGLAAILAVVLTVFVSALQPSDHPSPSPTPSEVVVPWQNLPYADPPAPSLSPRPVVAACRTADLRRLPQEGGGALGTTIHVVRLENKGTVACTLSGRPSLTGKRGGRTRTISTGINERDTIPGATPATIEPGEAADLEVLTYGGCLDGQPEIVYTGVRLRFANGDTLPMGEDLNATCGVNVGLWHRVGPGQVDPLAGVDVQIAAPATVRPGEDLNFVVTLVNPTPQAIRLDPCPSYLVILEAPVKIVGTYQLNCRDGSGQPRSMPPGASLSFEMRLAIPDDPALTVVPGRLRWSVEPAHEATAPVTIVRQ